MAHGTQIISDQRLVWCGDSYRRPPAIPDYEVLNFIGRGGFGEVWLCRGVDGILRAIKVVVRDHRSPEHAEVEFDGVLRAIPITQEHPGFVPILYLGNGPNRAFFYYVMKVADDTVRCRQFTPGCYEPRTLQSDIMGRAPFSPHECVKIGITLARAVNTLHTRALVHGDIKPANIVFINGEPDFADVGLVSSMTRGGTGKGTPPYSPQEGAGTRGADIFALGKVLVAMATGQDPAETVDGVRRQLAEILVSPTGRQLTDIIAKACEDDPSGRYRSVQELEGELERLPSTPPPPPPPPPPPWGPTLARWAFAFVIVFGPMVVYGWDDFKGLVPSTLDYVKEKIEEFIGWPRTKVTGGMVHGDEVTAISDDHSIDTIGRKEDGQKFSDIKGLKRILEGLQLVKSTESATEPGRGFEGNAPR